MLSFDEYKKQDDAADKKSNDEHEYEDLLRLGHLYDILDQALVSDINIGNIASRVRGMEFTAHDEAYIWRRYGICINVLISWMYERMLFDKGWQCDISQKVAELNLQQAQKVFEGETRL